MLSRNKTLRILCVLILITAAAIVGSTAYSYHRTENSLSVVFTDKSPRVEVGGEYKAMDYVAESFGKVTASAKYLDADTIGSKKLVYTVEQPVLGGLLTPEKQFTLTYTVIDTEPPLKIWSGDGTVIEKGSEFDISDVIGYGDNADPRPVLEVEGKVDTDTTGKYPLHVTVTDSSGNSTDWDLTVVVADSVPAYTDDSPRIKFKDFASEYAGTGRSFGIDVSVWQGDIDFKKVKAAGCDFVFIRIGYSADGEVTEDSKFAQNIERARAAGLRTGVYLYSSDNTEEEVRKSAGWVLDRLGGAELDLPIVFDWENFVNFQKYEMSFADLNHIYDVFEEEVSRSADDASASYTAMLYGSKYYLEKIWGDTDTRPVWLAHYTDKTDYKDPYLVWQARNTGRIAGIDGEVDLDIIYE